MIASATVMPVRRADHALMVDIQADAEKLGLILITDGTELAYTLPHHIPPGWTRFALFDKNAGRPHLTQAPREIRSGKT